MRGMKGRRKDVRAAERLKGTFSLILFNSK